jgi:hypothetical protein
MLRAFQIALIFEFASFLFFMQWACWVRQECYAMGCMCVLFELGGWG